MYERRKFYSLQVSPNLMRHVLRGGQVPGVSRITLDNIVTNFMKRMAEAAAKANRGQLSDKARNETLPALSTLPQEFISSVAAGNLLPGLSANETAEIKTYYLRQLSARAATSSTPPPDGNQTTTELPPGAVSNADALF